VFLSSLFSKVQGAEIVCQVLDVHGVALLDGEDFVVVVGFHELHEAPVGAKGRDLVDELVPDGGVAVIHHLFHDGEAALAERLGLQRADLALAADGHVGDVAEGEALRVVLVDVEVECSSSSCSSSSSRSSSSESDDSAPAAGGILQILEFVTRDPALLQGNFKRFF
jgi:hypothetical protein